jgi:aspartyl-tRNA(Asn)/glutamyl-tRNA(Gln) amidotransferase subunit C
VSIDREAIRRLERLAGLSLSDDERDAIAESLARVIDHFESIQHIDVRGAAAHRDPEAVVRDDVAQSGLDIIAAIGEAPDTEDGFIVVPPPFEHGESER